MSTRPSLIATFPVAALVASVAVLAPSGAAHAQSAIEILRAGCADDARKFCSGVQPGGGRVIACLKQNKESLSDQCKQAAAQVSRMGAGGAQSAAPAPSSGDTAEPPAAPAVGTGGSSPRSARATRASMSLKAGNSGAAGSYLVMKKVQITGPGPDASHPTLPAFDLMIPSTWKLEGGINPGGSTSGCFSDFFALHLRATSADGGTMFVAAPDASWQYADDPSALKNLTDPYRRAPGVGGKPCPVERPMRAEDYIRRNILKLYPAGTQVVSASPFPELNEIVRRRHELPPGNGNAGNARTDAVRVRLAYQKDGKDLEAWVAGAVVVDISPAGRGAF